MLNSVLRILLVMSCATVAADDWPMWRFDAGRSAAAPDHQMASELEMLWTRPLSPRQQAWDDPLNLDLMTYDRVFEPIAKDGRLFVGYNDRDKVVAFDLATGKVLWTAFAEGPVRLPPVAWQDRVFFASDDGHLYCVDAEDGSLVWRFRGAPNSQHAIGNRRVVSAWPARGGPVLRDGVVYFAASIWPFMGTFIYALDADSGEVVWVNDSTGAQYIKQPHSAPSFAGVAPQGALVATQEMLLVPGGRSVPAAFDRRSGALQYFEINAGGKGTGGSFVSADEAHFYVHTRQKGTRAFNLETGVKTAFMPDEPVLHEGRIYSSSRSNDDAVLQCHSAEHELLWEQAADGSGDLILVGNTLVAAGKDSITTVALNADGTAGAPRRVAVEGDIQRLIAADEKLVAVTLDGTLMVLGQSTAPAIAYPAAEPRSLTVSEDDRATARELLATGDPQGYAFWFGDSTSGLARALSVESPFTELVIVDPDQQTADTGRRERDAAHLNHRVSVHHAAPHQFQPPQYVGHMVFMDANSVAVDESSVRAVYECVRPYGGVLCIVGAERPDELVELVNGLQLEQARVAIGEQGVTVMRAGALPGSADWTHQYGDVANTVKSNDSRVKLPLGILWFGGSSNMDVLPRHGHGPPEQVVGGRLFIEGMNSLSARDVYTGRVLWKREFDDLGTFDVYYDATYADTPLDPRYNQVHIPGANGRGTNYVVTEDAVYVVEDAVCHVLNPSTGETEFDIAVPGTDPKANDRQEGDAWGYIGVYEDILIGGMGFARYRDRRNLSFPADDKLKSSRAGFGSKSYDRAASMALAGFDRHTGKLLWQVDAEHSFWHNGVVAGDGTVFCLDRMPAEIEAAMRRRGQTSAAPYRIVAINSRTGEMRWQITEDIFGTWLGYSEQHGMLLQAGAAASDRLYGEVAEGMAVYHGTDGSVVWKDLTRRYSGPCILHNDLIITNANSYSESAGAFFLRNGRQKLVENPLTGTLQPWKLTRAYGCNSIIASENFLTFRSGAAGFYDLTSHSGTGNLGGFKSGCTSNLVVANGVLNAPDYTRTCSCAYQNQTSLALVHMPDVEMWSVNSAASIRTRDRRIDHVGLNFGAPGDRRDRDGLLWLEFPATGGPSPELDVQFNDDAQFFQRHSSAVSAKEWPWVFASGAANVTDVTISVNLDHGVDLAEGLPVAHADDDAEEAEDGGVSTGSSDLELVEDSGTQLVGVRFSNVQLSPGAKIRSAHIQFTCDEPTDDPTSLIISVEDNGDADRFSGARHDISSRTLAAAEVGWSPDPWTRPGESGQRQQTSDLTELLQTVISRDDWKSGNAIAFVISGTGKRVASACRPGSRDTARLVVDVVPTDGDDAEQADVVLYDLRLFVSAPAGAEGDCRFDVFAQGERVLADVTIARDAGSDGTGRILEIPQVPVREDLRLQLRADGTKPALTGLELRRSQ